MHAKVLLSGNAYKSLKELPGGGGGGGDETSIYKENLKAFTVFYNFRAGSRFSEGCVIAVYPLLSLTSDSPLLDQCVYAILSIINLKVI